jgi:LAO/AO transport system kinase
MQSLKIYDPADEEQRISADGRLAAAIRQLIEEKLNAAAREGRVQCAEAMGIARSLGVRASDVGEVADEIRIRISRCQLGCF